MWIRALLLVAVAYVVIGVGFAALGWRIAAWVASATIAAVHIGYEHYRLGSPPRATALHAAGAVALGAFGLALAANVHWLVAGTAGHRPPLLALPVWPVITAVPAFVGALAAAAVLGRIHHKPGKPSL